MKDFFKSPIFILGQPRSGTSMVAGSISLCGAWAGTTVGGGSEANPKGFFEHRSIRDTVTKAILRGIGSHASGVKNLPPIDLHIDETKLISIFQSIIKENQLHVDSITQENGLFHIIKAIISEDGYQFNTPWLYKDAKVTLLWPLYKSAFPDAKWIIVKRDEEGFINSCLRTHFMSFYSKDRNFWKNFARQYHLRIEALKNTGVTYYELSSPEMIAGNFHDFKKVVEELGLNYDKTKLKEFISPSFWHANKEQS